MKKIIEIKDLGFDYGEGWVFHKLNLEIVEGDFVAVIGANGAGKSTLLKMLANVIEPTAGSITYYGTPVNEFKNWERVGYVPQNPGRQQRNFPISVREVVGLGLLKGNSLIHHFNGQDKAAINEIMERFNLTDLRYRKIGELSGGQQQRVFLARAMVKQPKILLLDEPATGIDTAAKADLYAMLKNINRQQGVTIVMVSHDLELAADAAQNALCLDHGICFWGEVHAALKHHHKHGYFYR
ncbi:MAG: metal ABC transporter ATP-binding protein [Phascolarctobacterium sp.]|nr:metal ABC transporter ATP-binding protein [Phascolarctobacterium sp.]